jgi:hypothetical protein
VLHPVYSDVCSTQCAQLCVENRRVPKRVIQTGAGMERARRLLGVWVWLALLRLGVAAPLELYTVPLASLKVRRMIDFHYIMVVRRMPCGCRWWLVIPASPDTLAAGLTVLPSMPLTLRTHLVQAPTEEVYDGVRNALGRVGMLAVTLDDAAAIERDVALREFVRCLAEGVAPESIAESTRAVVLEDGTVRTTIAVATNHSVAQPLPVRVSRRRAPLPPAMRVVHNAHGPTIPYVTTHAPNASARQSPPHHTRTGRA